ncbi:hybrid sensor histidine kinase/response regulator [Roseateles chitosanitabidus]|uniref:hybrid sensor histidine kinase/response regulator n=1 Tax=Roseateles chitosanitabidus TaxID=65048 RepID=UPI00082CE919|nr:hybrid sensor histidine kinase/response regulator [Roseateles chitosanitabidus]MBO9685365.1 hybrid sensor histidine kinase/response regulator [Roseateles chitosanitabidus]
MSALPDDLAVPAAARRPVLPILLVEDNDGDADLITELLAEAAPSPPRPVVRATRLSEAVALLERHRVAAVLLDLHLPDAAGIECVSAVRAQARDTPIVVLTGMEDDALALSCMTAGAQDYLSKQDVRPRTLVRAIDYAEARTREARVRMRAQALRLRSAELELENKRILEVSRHKGRLLANMSHELRTPLNAVIGFSQLLADGAAALPPDRVRNYAGHILSSGRHLLGLINDVLDLARLEAGGMELHPGETNVADVAREVLDVVTGSFADKPLAVDLEIDDHLGLVWTDALRLRQVLYNYLSNAWKFTPEGGHLTVRAGPCGDHRFRVEVEDTGPGIAEEDLARLFTEFTQLPGASRSPYPGTGLGLALTKRIVEAQGGRVGARSELGRGSTFFAELPDPEEHGLADPPRPS